jgi:hypothetical protein
MPAMPQENHKKDCYPHKNGWFVMCVVFQVQISRKFDVLFSDGKF